VSGAHFHALSAAFYYRRLLAAFYNWLFLTHLTD
jgi:hypothetical protein